MDLSVLIIMTLTFQGHVTSSCDHSISHRPLPICFFVQYFWQDAPFSHNTYVTDDRQTTNGRNTVA